MFGFHTEGPQEIHILCYYCFTLDFDTLGELDNVLSRSSDLMGLLYRYISNTTSKGAHKLKGIHIYYKINGSRSLRIISASSWMPLSV